MKTERLKIIPLYTGRRFLKEVLEDKKSTELLWLEIIFNDKINWENIPDPIIKKSYRKACIWYWNFKTLIDSYIKRRPLSFVKEEKPDLREYRKFLEVMNYVTG